MATATILPEAVPLVVPHPDTHTAKPLKVFLINSTRKFTGEGAHTLDLAEQLALHGHVPLLILHEDCITEQRAKERNLPILAELHFDGGVKYTLRDLKRLRQLIKQENPDVIHCHRGNDHGLAVAAVAGMRNRPAIIRTRHRVHPVVNRMANRWLHVRATDLIFAVSEKAASSFGVMRPVVDDKLVTIYSSVDTNRFNPEQRNWQWRRANGIADDELLVGLIARLQKVKGQEQFLYAAAKVAAKIPNVKFLIAGTGPKHKIDRMAQLASELGIADRVVFRDWLPKVNEVTASLDVGVLASLGSEGSSRVTYEYMASGVPVVATAVGCIPEIISDGQNGFVVPPRDVDALAGAVVSLLNNAELRAAFKQQGLERISTFHTRDQWIKKIIQGYREAIESRGQLRGIRNAFVSYSRVLR